MFGQTQYTQKALLSLLKKSLPTQHKVNPNDPYTLHSLLTSFPHPRTLEGAD